MINVFDTNIANCSCGPCNTATVGIEKTPEYRGPDRIFIWLCEACAVALHEKLGLLIKERNSRGGIPPYMAGVKEQVGA